MREKFVKDIDVVKSFVYFPLHYEPERVLLIGASFYADQISVIKNMFVVINKGDKSIGKNKCIYPLSGIYYNFIVSLYES